jgi:outer membrane protein assembly factor BamB
MVNPAGDEKQMRAVSAVIIAIAIRTACAVEAQQPAGQGEGASLAERFKQFDRNGDGKLSREEVGALPGLKAGFDYVDTNHDGGISLAELETAVAQWWQKRAEPDEPPAATAPSKRSVPRVAKKPAPERPIAIDVNSPQLRGPRGDGIAYGANLPVRWSTTSNVVWSCTIPGKGWSSPVVWGDRVFVTSAIGPGNVAAPPAKLGSVEEHIRGLTTTDEHQYMVHCVEWSGGKLLWSRCAHKGVPPGSIHPKNSYASETPVTDGERVYACFGNVGLFCYDVDGRELWTRKWGSYKMDWNWGPAASPALHGDLLLVLNDNQERSFLVALDKRTGKDVWRVERDEKSNWTSPFVWQNELRAEIVTSGSGKVRSYDLKGKLLWELRGMSGVTVPTPLAADGLLYIASGCNHSAQRPVYAIRPGATGDISLQNGVTANAYVAWSQRRAAPYVTSPLVHDGMLYILLDAGFLTAYDARTGDQIYGKQRFPGGKAAFTASPWAYDGKLFCLSETGETYVVEAGPEFRVLHVNRLDEAALATPAIARDSLIIRTLTKLYRIAGKSGSRPTELKPKSAEKP